MSFLLLYSHCSLGSHWQQVLAWVKPVEGVVNKLIALAILFVPYHERLSIWVLAIPLIAAVQFVFSLAVAISYLDRQTLPVAIAAITSCTNTSNPSVLIGAGLLARNAVAKGLSRKPWVKSSLAPGSRVVTDYLHRAGLDKSLDALGFNTVGYGCTTCIGNSGPCKCCISLSCSKCAEFC